MNEIIIVLYIYYYTEQSNLCQHKHYEIIKITIQANMQWWWKFSWRYYRFR